MHHISPKLYLPFIQQIKDKLKSDQTIIDICSKYKMDTDDLDLAPIKFDDIDVSAKTDKCVITLNWNLLEKNNRYQIPHYITHEFTHFCQQSNEPTQSADDGDYLMNPSEQEAFQFQIKYIDDQFGEDKAEDYTNQVLDHHDETGKERDKKQDILMKKIEVLSNHFLSKFADKTIDLQQKYPQFAVDIKFLSDQDPTPNKKYLQYAVKQLVSGKALANEISDVMNLFHKHQSKLDDRDINNWNFTDLRDKLFDIKNNKSKRQQNTEIKTTGAQTIYEDDQCKVLLVKDKAAACFYGSGTKWCITMRNEQYYEDYIAKNIVFFFILRKDLDQNNPFYKVAIACQRDQDNRIIEQDIFDALDNTRGSVSENKNLLRNEANILQLIHQVAIQQSKSTLAKLLSKEINVSDLTDEDLESEGTVLYLMQKQMKVPTYSIQKIYDIAKSNQDANAIFDIAKYYYTPISILDDIVSNTKDPYALARIADHKNATPYTLQKIIQKSNEPSKATNILEDELSQVNFNLIIKNILQNPNINKNVMLDIVDYAIKSDQKDLLERFAAQTMFPEILLQILSVADEFISQQIAKNPFVTAEILQKIIDKFLGTEDEWILKNVVRNRNATTNMIDYIANNTTYTPLLEAIQEVRAE